MLYWFKTKAKRPGDSVVQCDPKSKEVEIPELIELTLQTDEANIRPALRATSCDIKTLQQPCVNYWAWIEKVILISFVTAGKSPLPKEIIIINTCLFVRMYSSLFHLFSIFFP